VEPRVRRYAENEALFRELNDRIDDTAPRFFFEGEEAQKFVCECGHAGCREWITVKISEYEAIRDHPARFFVFGGHDEPEAERVVAETERFAVVEKIGEAAEIAEDRAAAA
jgi:hypothetical protein